MATTSCHDDDTPTNIRLSQGGKPKKSVRHTLTSGVPSMLRSIPRRARLGEVDIDDLAALKALHDVVDEALVDTVAELRHQHGYSWADVGRALGVTRQTAQAVYGAHHVEMDFDR
jgi:hypothetical protein